MDINPATLQQILQGQGGTFVAIDDDVQNVAKDLQAIHPYLRLRWSEVGEYFVIYMENPDTGDQELVTTAQELDQRIVQRIKKIAGEGYNYLGEIEKLDKQAEKEIDQKFSEQVQESAELLAHALRKDLGIQKDSARSKKSWGKGLRGYN